MNEVVGLEKQGEIAVITVDNPPVNAMSEAVRRGVRDALAAAQADPTVSAIVLRCAGRTFIAGADIKEFESMSVETHPNEIYRIIEEGAKPVVAALHGTALGGGFELALGCHYRCALSSARVGLPEVTLGILPGGGGTQRLPRLVGVRQALDLMVTGRTIGAAAALECGAIDEIVEGDLLEGAVACARRLVKEKTPLRNLRDLAIDPKSVPEGFFEEYRASIAAKTRGAFAPERIVSCVENAVKKDFDQGVAEEERLFWECVASYQSKALRHAFFAEREAAKIPGMPRDIKLRPLNEVAVIGGGTMGGGIAMNFANVGIPVLLVEVNQEALDRGLSIIRKNYESTVRKGRLTQAQMDERMGCISGCLDYAKLSEVDLVIEAVFENMNLKKEIFRKLDASCRANAILATNTSTLDVDEIAAQTSRPENVIGLHFFSPANVMRLLEIIRGAKTAPDVLATCLDMSRKIGKVGVVSGVCYGFIGNRMLEGYARENGFMMLEGVAPERVDRIMTDFGMAMGPNAVMDLAGIDVRAKVVAEALAAGLLPADERYEIIARKLYEKGRLGLKTGAGIFLYEGGSRTPRPDPEVQALIASEAARLGIPKREISDDEILCRCLYPLINEGARILEEGIALRPGDIDVVWMNGYGFPSYRGGPMHYADTVGLKTIYDKILEFGARFGNQYWSPAPLLERLALEGRSFADFRSQV